MPSILILIAAVLGLVGLFVIVQFVRGKLARNVQNATSATNKVVATVAKDATAVEATVAKDATVIADAAKTTGADARAIAAAMKK
jgi:hypothetical protein